jgi:hypothetical protein
MATKKIRWSRSGRQRIADNMASLKENLSTLIHYPTPQEQQLVEFCMLPAISLKWQSKPLWCMVVGPPSSGKTLHIELMKNWNDAVFVSSITKNSLISGYREDSSKDDDAPDPSLLPELDGKVMVLKDLTCLLEGPKDDLHAVMGQLRDVYDGEISKAFGNIGLQSHKSRFNMLIAVTPAIDSYHSVGQQLGERFIYRRETCTNRLKITQTAVKNLLTNKSQTNELAELERQFIQFIQELPLVTVSELHWDDEMFNRITIGADFAALVRSHVARERGGYDPQSLALPEVGARFGLQISQCIAGYCIANGIDTPGDDAWNFGGARVLRDTLPMPICALLYTLWSKHYECVNTTGGIPLFGLEQLGRDTRLGTKSVRSILLDLELHGLVGKMHSNRGGSRSTKFYLNKTTLEKINYLRLFDGYSLSPFELDLPDGVPADGH